MTKRKSDYQQTEEEITSEIEADVAAGDLAVTAPESEGMEEELFEELIESIKEAGAILRGEREPARRRRVG